MTTLRSFAARADIEAILAGRGAARTDVPVLQPADPFLDLAGEELRRRIFVAQSETGEALCLRPEFTIPVCRAHVAQDKGWARYGYVGTVFRQRRAGSNEFLQAGIEDIGNENTIAADARSIADAAAVLDELGVPTDQRSVVVGDQTVFDAVLAGLGLPAEWRLTLAQAFGNDRALAATLDRLAQPAPMPTMPAPIADPAESGERHALEQAITAEMGAAGLPLTGGRTAADIAARLLAKIDAARLSPDPGKFEALRGFLTMDVLLEDALAALADWQAACGVDLSPVTNTFAARVDEIAGHGLDPARMIYKSSFGRRLDYYTGLVFEMRSAEGEVLVGGGRYDRLLPLLGAPDPTPGVGFSIWLDRIPGGAA